jgi:UDPglucose--hexose-1-phosphate uridylyltransferase
LATLTQLLVLKLERLVPGAAYNWWLHQSPFAKPPHKPAGNWHWHLEILPRLSDFAGFELATGCHVTTLSPRESARQLREA